MNVSGPSTHRPQSPQPVQRPGRPGGRGAGFLVRWTVPPVVAAVPELRHRLRDTLREWGVPDEIEDTLLLVATELASNAVRHAAVLTDQVRVTAALGQGRVRLDVSDGHPFQPRALTDTGMDSEDGRGLLIVKLCVAESRGEVDVIPTRSGKTIRVRIPLL